MRLLIVDDSPRMRELLKEALAGMATEFGEAVDGADAVARYETCRPDWVLMDLAMRPVNGLEATATIIARHPEARVVMVSQYDEPEFRAAAHRAGALAFVSKEDLTPLLALLQSR